MNILCIGNSFSVDATRYLHQIARADKFDLQITDLYIGGCPLDLHFRNMLSEKEAYQLDINGTLTDFRVSLKEALLNKPWDYITIQQASYFSPNYETYQPYIDKVIEYVRTLCPKAKIVIHETWAYEQGSQRLTEELGYSDQKEMYNDIHASYAKAAEAVNADLIIPSGTLFQKLLENGYEKVHRDTFHARLGAVRYALGLLWYKKLTGNSVDNIEFNDFDEEVTAEEITIAKKCVSEL